MSSLTAHLRRPDDHARLAFRPACPICRRERLAGALPDDAIVGRRSRALLAAGVLAIASTAPTAVLAAEPDQEQEGVTAPEQIVSDQAGGVPDLDPGGQATELPLDVGPAAEPDAASDVADEAAASEQAPATDDEVASANAGDATDPVSAEPPEPPASEPPSPPPASQTGAPEPISAPAPSAATAAAPVATQHGPQADSTAPSPESESVAAVAPPRLPRHGSEPKAQRRSSEMVPANANRATPPLPAEAVGVPTVSVSTASQAPPAASGQTSERQAAGRGDRFHVVQRGESLWSIARELLGEDASVARIAREVNHLWTLNSARIGTGDPDLLIAGTRIALR